MGVDAVDEQAHAVLKWYKKLTDEKRDTLNAFLDRDQSRLIALLCQSGQHLNGFQGRTALDEPDQFS